MVVSQTIGYNNSDATSWTQYSLVHVENRDKYTQYLQAKRGPKRLARVQSKRKADNNDTRREVPERGKG
jgi:hypothetical protein